MDTMEEQMISLNDLSKVSGIGPKTIERIKEQMSEEKEWETREASREKGYIRGTYLSLNEIHLGDCLDKLREIPDESVDIILTSPPYNIGNMHSNSSQHGTYAGNNMDEDKYQLWQLSVLEEMYRVLKEEGSLFYNHKVRINKGEGIHPIEWLGKSEFILKQEIVWDQGKSPNNDKIRFFPYSERIYWMTKTPKTKLHNVNNLSDVWRHVPTHNRKETGHIAVMPVEVAELILDSVEGDIVLDPFMGSGTTAIASINKGRKYIGIEMDEGYKELAEHRINKHISKEVSE